MGWSGGDDIFDAVVQGLDEQDVRGERKTLVLVPLLDALAQADWDDISGSMRLHGSDEWVMEAFRRSNYGQWMEDDVPAGDNPEPVGGGEGGDTGERGAVRGAGQTAPRGRRTIGRSDPPPA